MPGPDRFFGQRLHFDRRQAPRTQTLADLACTAAVERTALGASVGMGYVHHEDGVNADYLSAGTFEIDIAGERIPATASLRPFYDSKNERIKA